MLAINRCWHCRRIAHPELDSRKESGRSSRVPNGSQYVNAFVFRRDRGCGIVWCGLEEDIGIEVEREGIRVAMSAEAEQCCHVDKAFTNFKDASSYANERFEVCFEKYDFELFTYMWTVVCQAKEIWSDMFRSYSYHAHTRIRL